MVGYCGDVRLGDTLDFKFRTRQYSTGAPFTLAGSPAVAAYVDDGTAEITDGVTLTTDFDSVTGLNHVRVEVTAGNGFAAGTNVQVVVTAGTVDSVPWAGEVVGTFSVENRRAVLADAAVHGGPTARLVLGSETADPPFQVSSSGGDAVDVYTSDAASNALSLRNTAKSPTGDVVLIDGGVSPASTGYGVFVRGGAGGAHFTGYGGGARFTSTGTGNGATFVGGSTGGGGDGIHVQGNGTDGHGIHVYTFQSEGLLVEGGNNSTGGHGVRIVKGGSGAGNRSVYAPDGWETDLVGVTDGLSEAGAASVLGAAVLTVGTPSDRLVDGSGQLTAVTLGQALAALLVGLCGDRDGVGTRTITATLPGVSGVSVVAERVSTRVIQATLTLPDAG